jgi:molybdopterin-guanine dinucleotide biosynthesis protein A
MPAFSPGFAAYLRDRVEAAEASAKAEVSAVSAAPGRGRGPLAALARFGAHFEPFHAFYHRGLIPRLESLFAGSSIAGARRPSFRDLFEGLPILYIPEEEARRFSPDWSLFFNINTHEDLERFRGSGRQFPSP